MSLDLSDPEIPKYIKLVQDGSPSHRWIVFSYVPKSTYKIKFSECGSGDLKELREELDDSSIRFAYIRYTINNMNKFVYISWVGDGVNGPIKGASSGHSIEFQKMFRPIHHQVNARNEEDIDEKAFVASLTKATGASYDSGSKVQGATKGTFIPSSVSQGREAATKSNAEVKNVVNKNDYNKVQESSDYWKQNQAVKTEAPKPVRTEYNLSTERDDYWKQQQAEKQQAATVKSNNVPPPSRTVGNKFQQQTQQQEVAPPPPRPAPSKNVASRFPVVTQEPSRPAAPPPSRPAKPIYQEPEPVYEEQQQYEQPAEEQQYYEEQPAEEQQYYEEQPAEEQQQQYYEEQPAEEQQQYYEEQPAEEQYYEEPQHYEEQQYEQPAEEQQYYEEQPAEEQYHGIQAKALYDYAGENDGDLSFREGDIITVLDQSDPDGWWQGSLPTGESGFFPSNFCSLV